MIIKNLVTFEIFNYLFNTGRSYRGFVCSPKEGKLYYADTDYQASVSTSPSLPNHTSLGYTNGTKFYDVVPTVELKMVDLERNDLIYDKKGNYIGLVEDNNEVLGEIFIRSEKYSGFDWTLDAPQGFFDSKKEKTNEKTRAPKYEYMKLGDVTLTPEAYSKIFTHIISLMKEVDLKTIKEEKISIELKKRGMEKRKTYNLTSLGGFYASDSTNAYMEFDFNKEKNKNAKYVIAAVLYDSNKLYYETAWNIMNLLGAHEYMGHAIRGYNNDDLTHHLAYLYQMGHPTWKHTTIQFKEKNIKSFNDYYGDVKQLDVDGLECQQTVINQRKAGTFPKLSETKDEFIKRISKEIQKKTYRENNLRDYEWKKWQERHGKR